MTPMRETQELNQGFRLVVISSGFARNLAGQNEISRSARNDKRKSCEYYIRNPNFETGAITPWAKRPGNGAGVFYVEQSENAIPSNGTWNAALEPNGGKITMQQKVLVNSGQKYRLQVWLSSSGVTTQLIWWTKEQGDHICNTVTKTWPDYGPIFCDFTVPAGTTNFKVKLRALAAPAGNWVVADGWSLSSTTHYYSGVRKSGGFNGVAATIGTPIPAIREWFFSYSTINIVEPCGTCASGVKGVEIGIVRGPLSGCTVKFAWSSSDLNWTTQFINNPLPVVGHDYRFYIFRVLPNKWRLQIWENMTMLYEHPGDLTVSGNGGFNSGQSITANGEVDSPNRYNDMGVSDFRSLAWMNSGWGWTPWNGWDQPINPVVPYVRYDYDNNNIQVYGNNGNALPPGSPCGY